MFVVKQTITNKATGNIFGENYWGRDRVYTSKKESLFRLKSYVFKTELAAKRAISKINSEEPIEFSDHSPLYDVTYEVVPYTA